jgi:hypothetical protein
MARRGIEETRRAGLAVRKVSAAEAEKGPPE